MHYPVNILEEKKLILKLRVKRIFSVLLSSGSFWAVVGYVIGTLHTLYILTNSFSSIGKEIAKVCGAQ